jgi:hypothetical protein
MKANLSTNTQEETDRTRRFTTLETQLRIKRATKSKRSAPQDPAMVTKCRLAAFQDFVFVLVFEKVLSRPENLSPCRFLDE